MEILREILNFVGGVENGKFSSSFSFFSTFWDIFRQAEGRGEAGYSTGATGLSGLRCNRTWKLHEPVFPAYPPLSRSLSPSPSRFPPDPASSYFARFPQMLIALFPNANSFLTSERRVYPAFLSLSLPLSSLFFLYLLLARFLTRDTCRPREVSILHLHGPRERDCGIKFANRVGN